MTKEEAPVESVPEDPLQPPDVGPMTEMPPEMAKVFAEAFAKAFVDKKTAAQPVPIIDFEALPLDLFGMVPKYGRWYWYKGWKRDPTDRKKIIYDIYVSPQKISKVLAKALDNIDTQWGPEKTKVYVLWTVTRARTYDPINKRVVPIRQVMMTPLMARRGADVAKLLDKLNPEVIKKSINMVKQHESLLWADMAQMKGREAATAWQIVEHKSQSHFKSTETMLKHAGEATDKGDEEFAKSFTEDKDWKDKIVDNLCVIIIGILAIIYMLGYGLGWWVT